MDLQYFNEMPFENAVKHFFTEIKIPVNQGSTLPKDFFRNDYWNEQKQNTISANMPKMHFMGAINKDVFIENSNGTINVTDLLADATKTYDMILVFAVDIDTNQTISKTNLADITRDFHKKFQLFPIIVVFKYAHFITIATTERLEYKNENKAGQKAGKVSMLKDMNTKDLHAGHRQLLESMRINQLAKMPINTFEALYTHWFSVFNISLLNKKFYKEIENWYHWASQNVDFPQIRPKNDSALIVNNVEHQQKSVIRLLTRFLFCWFIKEKGLIKTDVFEENYIQNILSEFSPQNVEIRNRDNATYYKAVLQNLFFATLTMPKEGREFAKNFQGKSNQYGVQYYYRYEKLFKNKGEDQIAQLFGDVPFLNGGLFDSLDKVNKEKPEMNIRLDGFSETQKNQAKVPDYLFFSNGKDEKQQDCSKGIINILSKYKFTIEENTSLEQEIALDPELLGQIFESLLASFNPETAEVSRKSTGSFYTPREIVEYMVEESILIYLQKIFPQLTSLEKQELDLLDKATLLKAFDELKILDPACGSGAYPMGILNKMVELLKIIDPDNFHWKATQKEKIIGNKIKELKEDQEKIKQLSDDEIRKQAENSITDKIKELDKIFDSEYNFDDYARKLFIIQNCIYGVDVQDIAIQISKLRFFLSLVIDQKNENIQPLPNLETKFVIANTLLGLDLPTDGIFDAEDKTKEEKDKLKIVREKFFTTRRREEKDKLKEQEKEYREKISQIIEKEYISKNKQQIENIQNGIIVLEQKLAEAQKLPKDVEEIKTTDLFGLETTTKIDKKKGKIDTIKQAIKAQQIALNKLENQNNLKQIVQTATQIATWDIYDQNAKADWFDAEWMFGLKTYNETGFDIIIGNPPYVQIQKLKHLQAGFEKQKFETYEKTGDLYCLFYEKGIQLLKEGGILCFITSNKWMRAGYGESMRKFFNEKTNPVQLVDFGGVQVFDSATVDTNILITQKSANKQQLKACIVNKADYNYKTNLSVYFRQFAEPLSTTNSWAVLSQVEQNLKAKIEKIGTPLKDWDISIYRGILTGFNEAFIINKEKRDELIQKCPKSAEIIRPILRGKDIKKYSYQFAELYLISTLPSLKIDIEKYPAVKEHLLTFGFDRLDQSGKPNARKKTHNKWFEMQDSISYWEDFMKEKIVFKAVGKNLAFSILESGNFLTAPASFFTSPKNDIKYILGLLHSKLVLYYVLMYSDKTGEGDVMLSIQSFDRIPIPKISQEEQKPFEILVNEILEQKVNNQDTKILENEIDKLVYKLYKLTDDEINIIKEATKAIK